VGGQLVLAGLVPGARRLDPSLPRALARRFAAISWPAFAVLVVTGIWNIAAVHATFSGAYGRTLMVKIGVVAISGLTALLHSRSRSKSGLAAFGALAGLSAIGALLLGIQLHG
jgi:putative copper export protein